MARAKRAAPINGTPVSESPVRITLTPREFQEHYGLTAIATLQIQSIQRQAAEAIAAAQQTKARSFLRLVKKYRAQGLRADQHYTFDEATHSLVALPPKG